MFNLERFVEGQDFFIRAVYRQSDVLVIALHGGKIEPRTSQIAVGIAGDLFNLYDFQGIRESNNWQLHVPSTDFSDIRLDMLIAKSSIGISIHGEKSYKNRVIIGGLNYELRDILTTYLRNRAFDAIKADINLKGEDPRNVVNRLKYRGVQLEISADLRLELTNRQHAHKHSLFNIFITSIRAGIIAYRNKLGKEEANASGDFSARVQ